VSLSWPHGLGLIELTVRTHFLHFLTRPAFSAADLKSLTLTLLLAMIFSRLPAKHADMNARNMNTINDFTSGYAPPKPAQNLA
jgi:hypothetical protein